MLNSYFGRWYYLGDASVEGDKKNSCTASVQLF
jgi:hypothetical protein